MSRLSKSLLSKCGSELGFGLNKEYKYIYIYIYILYWLLSPQAEIDFDNNDNDNYDIIRRRFWSHSKKLKKSGIFRILHYLYLQMSKICRNFVVSKDKAERAVIKEKNC